MPLCLSFRASIVLFPSHASPVNISASLSLPCSHARVLFLSHCRHWPRVAYFPSIFILVLVCNGPRPPRLMVLLVIFFFFFRGDDASISSSSLLGSTFRVCARKLKPDALPDVTRLHWGLEPPRLVSPLLRVGALSSKPLDHRAPFLASLFLTVLLSVVLVLLCVVIGRYLRYP